MIDMFDKISRDNLVIGSKQVLKGIEKKELKTVYIAQDTDDFLKDKLTGACKTFDVKVVFIKSKADLGKACGINVETATCGIYNR